MGECMVEKSNKPSWVIINRAPVLTLWAAVVAEVLGFEHDEALTLGRAVVGLNTYSKGVSLGLSQPTPQEVKEQRRKMRKEETVIIDLLHRAVPAKHTEEGLRALSGESPIHPESVRLRGRRGKCKLVVPSNSLVPQFACNKNLLVYVTYEVTIEL